MASITYFDRAGAANTDGVLAAVRDRLSAGDVGHVVVASITGETGLRVARAVADTPVRVVCVSGPPAWDAEMRGRPWPYVQGAVRDELRTLGVALVETALSTLGLDSLDGSLARYGFQPAALALIEALVAVGGYGLKTAVEVLLMATDAAAIPPFVDAIAVGGTGDQGTDVAIVARSTYSTTCFSPDAAKRLQVREILAMPRHNAWWRRFMGHDEITRGEAIER